MYHITALGELLIDFTPGGSTPEGILLYQRNPGGAPANTLAMAARWGCATAFLGKVGKDSFGDFLRHVLEKEGINVSGLVVDNAIPTTLAFVSINAKGDRSFSFYRSPGADMMLAPQEVRQDIIQKSKIFHFGSLSLVEGPCREATYTAVECARKAGSLVSYDPNYRPLLWKNEAEAVQQMLKAVPLAHILKVSEEEAELLTGEKDAARAAKALMNMGPQAVLITLGESGAHWLCPAGEGRTKAFMVDVVDTTGSGDAFMGSVLAGLALSGKNLAKLCWEDWENLVDAACAAGSLVATRKGSINAMPSMAEIDFCRLHSPRIE